jgi:ribosomal protein S27AE
MAGTSAIRAAPVSLDRGYVSCPQCGEAIRAAGGDWFQCASCRYEIHADAWQLHQDLLAQLDDDPDKFFLGVAERLADLREAEPVWQRSR